LASGFRNFHPFLGTIDWWDPEFVDFLAADTT
jgi:hypothetical protein